MHLQFFTRLYKKSFDIDFHKINRIMVLLLDFFTERLTKTIYIDDYAGCLTQLR